MGMSALSPEAQVKMQGMLMPKPHTDRLIGLLEQALRIQETTTNELIRLLHLPPTEKEPDAEKS